MADMLKEAKELAEYAKECTKDSMTIMWDTSDQETLEWLIVQSSPKKTPAMGARRVGCDHIGLCAKQQKFCSADVCDSFKEEE